MAPLLWASVEPKEISGSSIPGKRSMETPTRPQLTPQFCFSEKALRGTSLRLGLCLYADAKSDFLRTSRGLIDDSIIQNLNALMTPAKQGWDPSSTSERQIRPKDKRPTDPRGCQHFKDQVLFQSWQARSDVLNYCAGVALNPDDPDLALKEADSAKERERVVDERLDPYSGRFFPREARTETLANLIRIERNVESIVRSRSWGLVAERCGSSQNVSWEDGLNEWRSKMRIHET